MCIGAIIMTKNGKRGEIISINYENRVVIVNGIYGGYWSEKIDNVKVISYRNVRN